ncbi:C2H2-type domain-containing protein [Citrus sinensis]|nr:C2H2-type domain-containing protein [Citrus sinensis]
MLQKFHNLCDRTMFTRLEIQNPFVSLFRFFSFGALFTKPITNCRTKNLSSFGVVKFIMAYANSHAFSYVPQVGVIRPAEPYVCGVCGRSFYDDVKLVNYFMQIYECKHKKRLNRVHWVGKYSIKMEKYKRAARAVLTPEVGNGLIGELKRGGLWVRTASDKPQATDVLLRNHLVITHKRRIEYLVVVSDDSDFVEVLLEANLRCLKTVVVGDINDGALKRISYACFSWWDILMGKARKEAVSVVGKWKDGDVLKRLEWTYDPEVEKKALDWDDGTEGADVDDITLASDADFIQKEDGGALMEAGFF